MNTVDVIKVSVKAAQNKKASRLVAQDLRGLSEICDYQLICSGENDRQTRAIAKEIEETLLKEFRVKPVLVEGEQAGNWILMDFGGLMIHIFASANRDYYALEHVWPDAKLMDATKIS